MDEPGPDSSDALRKRPLALQFGASLRSHRRALGWTQVELAEAAGVSRTFVQNLEAGTKMPTLETAFMLFRALAVPVGPVLSALEAAWEPEP